MSKCLLVMTLMMYICRGALADTPDELVFEIGSTSYQNGDETGIIDVNPEIVPFIDNATGQTMAPLRCLAEALGYSVDWYDGKVFIRGINLTITVVPYDKTVSTEVRTDNMPYYTIGMQEADSIGFVEKSVWNKHYELDAEPLLYRDRTFVPVKSFCQLFGYDVYLSGQYKTIKIHNTAATRKISIEHSLIKVENAYKSAVTFINMSVFPMCHMYDGSNRISIDVYDSDNRLVLATQDESKEGNLVITAPYYHDTILTVIDLNKLGKGDYRAVAKLEGNMNLYGRPIEISIEDALFTIDEDLSIILPGELEEAEIKAKIMKAMVTASDEDKTNVVLVALKDKTMAYALFDGSIIPQCSFLEELPITNSIAIQFQDIQQAEQAVGILNSLSYVRYAEIEYRIYLVD